MNYTGYNFFKLSYDCEANDSEINGLNIENNFYGWINKWNNELNNENI